MTSRCILWISLKIRLIANPDGSRAVGAVADWPLPGDFPGAPFENIFTRFYCVKIAMNAINGPLLFESNFNAKIFYWFNGCISLKTLSSLMACSKQCFCCLYKFSSKQTVRCVENIRDVFVVTWQPSMRYWNAMSVASAQVFGYIHTMQHTFGFCYCGVCSACACVCLCVFSLVLRLGDYNSMFVNHI